MKILCISDNELYELYQGWNEEEARKLSDIGLILSAGDLCPEYLEFLVTMLNVPLVYVRGNHDSRYDMEPPEGCDDADDKVIEVMIGEDGSAQICENIVQGIQGAKVSIAKKAELRRSSRLIRIAGLGGSIGYNDNIGETYSPSEEYTESEMKSRANKLRWMMKDYAFADRVLAGGIGAENSPVDIFLTHSPAFGHGDLPNPSHTGFKCFNEVLMESKPSYHIYGHVHKEYARIERESTHPAGTREINVFGMYILEV